MEDKNLLISKLNEQIVENIVYQLKRKGISQKDLSILSGLSQPTLSKLLLQKSKFAVEQLARIAIALQVDISDLVSFKDLGIESTNNINSINYILESDNLIFDISRPAFKGYVNNKYFIYFNSTISTELQIICGELTFKGTENNRCRAELIINTGKTDVSGNQITKKYIGDMIISISLSSCYCILINHEIGEFCFLIFHHMFVFSQDMVCRMAVSLTTSSGANRRPTIHRMVLSKYELDTKKNSNDYIFLQGQLRMNNKKIIISKAEFDTLRDEINQNIRSKELIDYFNHIQELLSPEEYYVIDENQVLFSETDVMTKVRGISMLREKSVADKYNKVSLKTDEFLYEYISHCGNLENKN